MEEGADRLHGVPTNRPTDCKAYIQTSRQTVWCTYRQAGIPHGVHTDRQADCKVYIQTGREMHGVHTDKPRDRMLYNILTSRQTA